MDRETIRLRAGDPADVPAMYELDLICFEEPFRFDLKAMRRFASSPRATVLVADSEIGLAGFVIVHRRRGFADVVTLDVQPESRRQGLAGALLQAAEQQATNAGASWMELHVFVGNAIAIRFYGRAGYGCERIVRNYYGAGLDAFLCRRSLASTAP